MTDIDARSINIRPLPKPDDLIGTRIPRPRLVDNMGANSAALSITAFNCIARLGLALSEALGHRQTVEGYDNPLKLPKHLGGREELGPVIEAATRRIINKEGAGQEISASVVRQTGREVTLTLNIPDQRIGTVKVL